MQKPYRCAVLGSGGFSALRYLYENDPAYGRYYHFVGAFSDVPRVLGLTYAEERGIATAELDFREWCEISRVNANDVAARGPYFTEVSLIIGMWRPDFIILSGFMLIVTDPLLRLYQGRILNVHPALLSLLDEQGGRRYRGVNVVQRAMTDGQPTGSTVHLVTGELDGGPIVAESRPLPYEPGDDPESHQRRMKTACDGPAYVAALERLFARDWPRVSVV